MRPLLVVLAVLSAAPAAAQIQSRPSDPPTLEPFSIVYVPLSRGLMQPYERPRRGALAGTTGRAGFPVYARRGLKEETIYLPARPGVVAPYRLKN